MKVCNLASGSTGNVTYVETKKYKILIDAGKNKKYIVDNLKKIGVDYHNINYIFITHSHDDHISALKTLVKGTNIIVVMTQKIFNEIKDVTDIEHIIIYEDFPEIEGLDIKSYKMSHDVADIRAYVISEDNKSFVYITDTGYIKESYIKDFANKDAYFIESNHDIEMLKKGPYPKWLQARVLSDVGHLSNIFAGIYLSKMIGKNTNNIMLMHLSEKNNSEEIALKTVKEQLSENDISKVTFYLARPSEISEVINI